jgi:hypothetical protein
MSDFRTYVTQTGFGLERDAKFNNTQVDLAVLVVGDGVLPDSASPAERTDLIHQVREYAITIEKDDKDPNVWIARGEIPASDGGFFIKEAGIKTTDGELYSYARQAGDYKPLLSEGQGKSYTIRLKFIPGNAETIQIKIDPSVQFATPTDLSNAVQAHIEVIDPHPQYKDYADQKDTDHTEEEDPHDQYLKKTENIGQLNALKQIPIYPVIFTDGNVFEMDLIGSDLTVSAGQIIRMHGWNDISTDDLVRSFSIDTAKTYHVRFSMESGIYIKAVDDASYNPDSLSESDRLFDTTYDDALLAKIEGAIVTALINLSDSLSFTYDGLPNSTDSALGGNDYTGSFELPLNWSRSPVSDSVEIKGHFTLGDPWNDLMSTTVMLTREKAALCPIVFDKTYILNRYESRLPVAHANGRNNSTTAEPIVDIRMFEKIVRIYGY